jgi:hypothetical protein
VRCESRKPIRTPTATAASIVGTAGHAALEDRLGSITADIRDLTRFVQPATVELGAAVERRCLAGAFRLDILAPAVRLPAHRSGGHAEWRVSTRRPRRDGRRDTEMRKSLSASVGAALALLLLWSPAYANSLLTTVTFSKNPATAGDVVDVTAYAQSASAHIDMWMCIEDRGDTPGLNADKTAWLPLPKGHDPLPVESCKTGDGQRWPIGSTDTDGYSAAFTLIYPVDTSRYGGRTVGFGMSADTGRIAYGDLVVLAAPIGGTAPGCAGVGNASASLGPASRGGKALTDVAKKLNC